MGTKQKATAKKAGAKHERLFVHHETDAIIVNGTPISAGCEVPKKFIAEAVREYRHSHVLIGERLYKQEFSRMWNQRFPKEPCPAGFDVEPDTGDSVADGVREV